MNQTFVSLLRRPLRVLPLLLALAGTAQAQRPATFGAVTAFSTGGSSRPRGIAVADVNGDGNPDLLTANYGTSTAGVQLGTGTGTFGTASTFSTGVGSLPRAIAVADVNGDGNPDLLTANNGKSTASVLLGTGTGTFGTASTFSTGTFSEPRGIAVADVNGDGKPDLLTANIGSNTVGVLLGTGTGSFGAVTTFGTGSQPCGIAVADVNGDGQPDIITANNGDDTVAVLLGTGTGTFGPFTAFGTGSGSTPYGVAVADVNGDGNPDLLTANSDTNKAGVLLGTGTGSFGSVRTYSAGPNSIPFDIAVGDVNNDGKLDLLTANAGSDTVGMLLGTGTGTFGPVTALSTGSGSEPWGVVAADVDGDGRLDLLTANNSAYTTGVLLNTTPVLATRTFLPVTNTSSGNSPRGVAVADVNGDGKLDLLTANYGNSTAGVLLGTGTGSFGAVTTFSSGGGLPRAIAVADVNGDGKPDLLTANNSISSNSVGVLLGTGTGSFGAATTFSAGGNSAPRGLAVADVNGDGKPDVLTANYGTDAVGVLLGTGTGSFGAVSTYSTGSNSQPRDLAVADVNGDGKLDVLTANLFNNTVGVLLGTGTGSFGAVTAFSTGSGSTPYDIAVADVNGDGQLDALTVNAGNGTAGVLLGTGTGSFGAVSTYSTGGSSTYALAVADVNGDGQLDLLTANSSSGTASVLLGTGTGSFGAAATYSTGTNSLPFDIAVADVNGDGKPDLLTANSNSGTAGVLLGGLDLVVSTTTGIYADALYTSFTVTSTGVGTLASPISVAGSTTVQSGGVLNDGCFVLSGPGSFTLAAGGTLGICSAQGISSSGSTGAVQVTGTRTFDADARYTYNGSAAQVTGTGLPATVRALTLSNGAGLTLTDDVTATSAVALTGGVLRTGSNALTLGPTATLSEDADGYATGTVQTTRNLSTAGTTQTFGGLGLTLTPSSSRLPGSTLVVRTTGTARTGAGTSQSVKRVFDIQPAVRTGLNVALALTVRDDERNGIAAANLRLFKSDNAGTTWQPQKAATLATTAASGSQPTTHTASLSGISNFSLWTLGNAANPLPVELATFTAQAQGTGALLQWTTASELNNAGFEVESSADGARFARLGTVAGAGSSTQAHTYAFVDEHVARYAAPLVYYRLRQVDLDGTASYSPVRTVAVGPQAKLALFPNPVTQATTLTGAQPDDAVTVFDALGRQVLAATADAAGKAALTLPQGLATGVYVVRVGSQALRLVVE
ncbi:T9SS type A sorting domain-containing protein [Hymenobacter ruricola]|nr:T9SS type A sorting domain-containing protein [Hymenobacter ruricola]